MDTALVSIELKAEEFKKIRDLLYDICGINMPPGKEGLVKARLMKRLKALQIGSFGAYVSYVQNDQSGHELAIMVDELTTNKTNFYREMAHFDFMAQHVLPVYQKKRKMRIWSAACSTGEEPYTISMQLHDCIPNIDQMDMRILATDISPTVLAKAQEGVYEQNRMDGLSQAHIRKYFTVAKQPSGAAYRVSDRVRSLVTFARLNLMGNWPMNGPFDVIFCRNVMIYFDKETREKLVQRFHGLLCSGGYLLVGHSESLSSLTHSFEYVQPAIYKK